jgi:hypothetical protein
MQHSNAHAAALQPDLGALEQQIRDIDSRLLRLATSMGATVGRNQLQNDSAAAAASPASPSAAGAAQGGSVQGSSVQGGSAQVGQAALAPFVQTGLAREELARLARAEYKNRRRREQVLDAPDLFADPAWDILLDLFVSRLEGKAISTSSACIASCVPVTTALRWLTALEASGMIRKLADRRDKRRVHVEITDLGMERLTRYFEGNSH